MPDGAPTRRAWFSVNAAGGATEIAILDEIGGFGISAKEFLEQLRPIRGPIDLRISSLGGDVFAGLTIADALKRRGGVTVHVDVAASIASVIAMAGDRILIAETGFVMVHDPSALTVGTADDLDRMADVLRKIKTTLVGAYRRSGQSDETIARWMSAETWFDSQEAIDAGLADGFDDRPLRIAARFDLSKFQNVPPGIRAALERGSAARGGAMDPITLDRPAETPATPAIVAAAPDVTAVRAAYRSAERLGLENSTVDALIDDGVAVAQVPERLIEIHASRASAASSVQRLTPAGTGTRILRDERETLTSRVVDALVSRITGKTPPEHSREFAGMRLADIADAVGHGSGDRGWFSPRAAGLHTTSDFPNLLGTSAQRSLMDFYAVQASPMLQLARRNDAADFRERQRVRLGEAPALQQVLEHGEVTSGTAGEQAESITLATYARIFGLTRQAIINDDLGAFSDQLRWWATAVASLEATKLVATLSQTMSDSVALFHSTHGNLAGSGGAISVATISAGRVAMRSQTGIGGTEVVGAPPRYLLTGAAKETEAQQIVSSLMPAILEEVNPFSGQLIVLTEPRISGNAWFLFADPQVLPCVEYSYLSRSPGPQLEVRQGFEILGSEFRVLLDFAAGAVDWRGCYKNPGA